MSPKKRIRNIIDSLLDSIGRIIGAFKDRNNPKPVFLSNYKNGSLKIHVGSGDINLQGWINIDARSMPHVHIVSDDLSFSEFTDGSIDEIYMCHILEHLTFEQSENALEMIKKKLKKGGVLRLSIPCFDSIIKIYTANGNDIDSIKYALMGGQDYEFNYHRSVYNFNGLASALVAKGFINIKTWDPLTDFGKDLGDWSNASYETSIGKIKVSLNIKAES